MKKIIILIFSLFCTTIICSSQIRLEGKNDVYRSVSNHEWASLEITADSAAIKYVDKFDRAINSPGIPVLVENGTRLVKFKTFFKKLVKTEECFIVYNDQKKNIDYIDGSVVKEESSYLVFFSFVSIFLMIIANRFYKKEDDRTILYSFLSTLVIMITIYFLPICITGVIAATCFVLAFVVAVISGISFRVKSYNVLSIIFYILMGIFITSLFYIGTE